MAELAIRTEHLSRSFGAVRVVDDLSLEVPAEIIFGFLGANGAGKTTTIHLLLGLLEPTTGQASVLGFGRPGRFPGCGRKRKTCMHAMAAEARQFQMARAGARTS